MQEIEIRKCPHEYLPFIFATWLHSYKNGSYFARRIRKSVFFTWHHKLITNILDRDSTTVLIASSIKDPSLLYGYIVFEKQSGTDVVHYVFVKESFRKFGIGRKLFKESGVDLNKVNLTHWCYDTDWIIQKYPEVTYNPYII